MATKKQAGETLLAEKENIEADVEVAEEVAVAETEAEEIAVAPAEACEEEPKVADFKCEKCGSDMILKKGPYGEFYACINYPECKFTKQKSEPIDVPCPKCGSRILTRYGRGGRTVFYSCERYPECDFSTWDLPVKETCPNCGDILYRKKGRNAVLICHKEGCGFKKKAEDTNE